MGVAMSEASWQSMPHHDAIAFPLSPSPLSCPALQAHLAAEFNREGFPVMDSYVYVLCGDGCLQVRTSRRISASAARPKKDQLRVKKSHVWYPDFPNLRLVQEGVSSEACSLAGHLGLGRLIVLYDDNKITIDGERRFTILLLQLEPLRSTIRRGYP